MAVVLLHHAFMIDDHSLKYRLFAPGFNRRPLPMNRAGATGTAPLTIDYRFHPC